MRHTTAATLAALSLATLAACGSSHDEPAHAPAVSSPAPTKTSTIHDCAKAIEAGRDTGDGAPECTDLPLADYYKAVHQANRDAQGKARQGLRDAETATP